MASSDPIEKSVLHDWVEDECRALDVVASWETLCDVYRTLEFSDSISDTARMEEYQWIIAEMNKHLTRARTKLLSCQDPESMVEVLEKMFSSTGTRVTNRQSLTYHKLRQIWVRQMIAQLKGMMAEKEEDQDGHPGYWNE